MKVERGTSKSHRKIRTRGASRWCVLLYCATVDEVTSAGYDLQQAEKRIDASTSLIDHGATTCTIEHAPIANPDAKFDRVLIDCGQREILLTSGSGNGMSFDTVSEHIGHYTK
jgi:hypothetical protein